MVEKLLGVLIFFFATCHALALHSQVTPIFQKYLELNQQFLKADDSGNRAARERLETYMYHEYTKALHLMETTYCSEPDDNALDAFIAVLTATSNSAYEKPSVVLGTLYICQPDMIINKIHTLESEEKRYIVNTLDWGFQNAAYGQENDIDDYAELSKRLKTLKAETE